MEHCAAISAGQRRRHAARRVLAAVEAVHAAVEQPSQPAYSGIPPSRRAAACNPGSSLHVLTPGGSV